MSSGSGGIAPFVGICTIAAAFGIADGHVQGGMTGDLSLMCPEFVQVPFYIITVCNSDLQETFVHNLFDVNLLPHCSVYVLDLDSQSFFGGVAASGAITAALRFFTKAVFENSRDGLRKGASMWQTNNQICIYVMVYL